MSEKTYDMVVPVVVTVTVNDDPTSDDDPIMHPLDPGRMEGIYETEDPAAMLAHLAYNAIRNGKECASGLDGWGDIRVLTDEHDDWPQWRRVHHVRTNHPVRMEITDVDIDDVDYLDPPPTTADVQPRR